MPRRPITTSSSKRMTRKLQIKKETLTRLSPGALAKANGGDGGDNPYPTCPCTFSCPSATACAA